MLNLSSKDRCSVCKEAVTRKLVLMLFYSIATHYTAHNASNQTSAPAGSPPPRDPLPLHPLHSPPVRCSYQAAQPPRRNPSWHVEGCWVECKKDSSGLK